MANHTDYRDQYDVEEGDELTITVEWGDMLDKEDGEVELAAHSDQDGGEFQVGNERGTLGTLKLRYMSASYQRDDVIGSIWMQGEAIGRVTDLEVQG